MQAMWQKIARPDLLIYLDASFPVSTSRRQLNWQKKDHDEQLRRLAHAREHASLFVDTDDLTPEQVLQKVLDYLRSAAQAQQSRGPAQHATKQQCG